MTSALSLATYKCIKQFKILREQMAGANLDNASPTPEIQITDNA
jgi:hypothetical protein